MNAPLGVGIAGAATDEFVQLQQAVWASLPLSITSGSEPARLVAVDGRQPDWLDAADQAVRSAVNGVLIVRPISTPAPEAVRALARLADDSGVSVVVETTWAAHPAIAGLAGAAATSAPEAALVDSLAVIAADDARSSADVFLDQLAVLRAVFRPLVEVRFVVAGSHGYTITGAKAATTITLSAVRSASACPGVRLTIYGASAEAHIEVPTNDTAVPASAWTLDEHGLLAQPSWYESGSRASWRRITETAATKPAADLDALADDLALVVTTLS